MRPVGWRNESYRHYLAAKGIKTACRNPMRPIDVTMMPRGDRWIAERKWDGTRMIAEVKDGRVRLVNRRCVDKTKTFPELQELAREVKGEAVLDGEIVVLKGGKDDFKALAERDHLKDAAKIAEKQKESPVRYTVFDILERNGKDIRHLPLQERRAILEHAVDNRGYTRHAVRTTMEQAKRQGAEGVIFKDKTSRYVEGRSKAWQKFKFRKENDVVATGYEQGKGKREGLIGALHIAVKTPEGYKSMGKVGTGMADEENAQLKRMLDRGAKPVIRVRYLKVGSQGAYREPVYLGLRTDIRAEDTHV